MTDDDLTDVLHAFNAMPLDAVVDLFDAALDAVGSWPGFAPGAIDVELLAHHAAVYALRDALERVGVLDSG